jgi:FKBP-type peptidyl-prolyl cis-trans isomerase FklB
MKRTHIGILKQSCSVCIMVAAAALVDAQTPVPSPAAPPPDAAPAATPDAELTSYWFGLTFGEQMHHLGITDQVSMDAFSRGIKDGWQGKKIAPADQKQLQVYVRSVMEAAVLHNQTAAKDFLEHNSHEKGVTTTASGLQYKIIVPGDKKAAAPAPTDEVTVQYRGKLLDGSEFDSTYKRGAPMSFTVNGVIPGWREALVMMKPGAKWQVFVPPELGYGNNATSGIPAASLLIFEVELLSVKSGGAASIAAPKAK